MSFRNRLALFLMVTLVCVQAATAIFAYAYLREQVVEQGKRDLSAAMQAFTRQIDFLSQRASDGVKVLALDYAFRSAVARSDHNTELSVLRNHGRRIGAARMLLVRLDGNIAADTAKTTRSGSAFPFPALLGAAATGDRSIALVTLANQIYWIVVVPVRAPVPIAFIAACIPLDNNLVDEMRRISSSRHTIMLATEEAQDRWNVAAHTTVGTPRYVLYAQNIHDSGEHLRALVERMLDLAQAHAGDLAMDREPLSPVALLRDAAEIHRGLARQARIFLIVTSEPESAHIEGDALKLRQGFANIIHNAIKFTPAGGTVTISTAIEGAQLEIRVADTGSGIGPELLQSTSKPFQRLRSALDGRHQGAGLGLAFATAVFELHGGL